MHLYKCMRHLNIYQGQSDKSGFAEDNKETIALAIFTDE